ncbi:hypothetical protein AB1Y20_008886 [Prymnesium parvum]|uniref:Uncharacterized protein n=1 Tax=Prymnesium parvum TaxID=97485 RepID=A0AB34IUQ8_PRYPA
MPGPGRLSEEEGSEYKELADVDASAARGAPQAAMMPDGTIVMLSPENPYHSALAIGEPPVEAQPSDAAIQATLALLRPALQLERMARLVRLLAMFDMAFSLMHAVAEIWPAAIAAIMSYCGYLGARTFRRDLSRVYLIYLVLFALARVALSAHFIFSPLPPNTPPSLPMYMALTAIVQLVIAHFVWRFYCMLPRSATEARFVQHIADLQAQHVLTV